MKSMITLFAITAVAIAKPPPQQTFLDVKAPNHPDPLIISQPILPEVISDQIIVRHDGPMAPRDCVYGPIVIGPGGTQESPILVGRPVGPQDPGFIPGPIIVYPVKPQNPNVRIVIGPVEPQNSTGPIVIGPSEPQNSTGPIVIGPTEPQNSTGPIIIGPVGPQKSTGPIVIDPVGPQDPDFIPGPTTISPGKPQDPEAELLEAVAEDIEWIPEFPEHYRRALNHY